METTTIPRCAVVVPCYNEGARLQCSRFLEFVRGVEGVSLLFVNDGSTDNTLSVLEWMKISSEDKIQVLNLKQNMGKAEAVRLGILAALQDPNVTYVGFWDADLATPLEAVPEFLSILAADRRLKMIFGSRVRLLGRQVERRAVRHYLGRVFASCASIVLRLPIYDTQCGAKIFQATPELQDVLREPFCSRWVFDVEVLARFIARYHGSTTHLHDLIFEFPLRHWRDVAGSKVRPGDFFAAFFDVFRIYLKYLVPGAKLQSLQDLTPRAVDSRGLLQ